MQKCDRDLKTDIKQQDNESLVDKWFWLMILLIFIISISIFIVLISLYPFLSTEENTSASNNQISSIGNSTQSAPVITGSQPISNYTHSRFNIFSNHQSRQIFRVSSLYLFMILFVYFLLLFIV
ncbi:hypothetical protein A0H76_257 [Hepatospora eriocheir]|uniref:Uncharacterized protein n=1 Tax=Hepatospora eriocheir TaxID=1081669 RepID=A0A1X0QJ30_9MICR|nr:hypothetical protein A0H76_257 [Hepatospora eriocheir]